MKLDQLLEHQWGSHIARHGEMIMPNLHLDIGIFAHDEADTIGALIADLANQDIFEDDRIDLRVTVLANGCRDATVAMARSALERLPASISERITVLDFPEGGKSRTAHRFIHKVSRASAELLGFMDADITLPRVDVLRRMAEIMADRPELSVFTSRPIKDVVHHKQKTGLTGRLIAAGGDGLTDWRRSICGQLFFARAAAMRRIGLPAGLPVEDGFFRAMLLTDLLTQPEDLQRIDGHPEIFHVYESIRTIPDLINHQARIVIGSAINARIYAIMRQNTSSEPEAHSFLMTAAADPSWLTNILADGHQKGIFRQIPGEFMAKRIRRFRAVGSPTPKRLGMLSMGLVFDGIVWALASYRMSRGAGAGHW